jgi:hypothetical protein
LRSAPSATHNPHLAPGVRQIDAGYSPDRPLHLLKNGTGHVRPWQIHRHHLRTCDRCRTRRTSSTNDPASTSRSMRSFAPTMNGSYRPWESCRHLSRCQIGVQGVLRRLIRWHTEALPLLLPTSGSGSNWVRLGLREKPLARAGGFAFRGRRAACLSIFGKAVAWVQIPSGLQARNPCTARVSARLGERYRSRGFMLGSGCP